MSISVALELSSSTISSARTSRWSWSFGTTSPDQVETGLDNFTVLAPLEGEASNFIIINHAPWDGSLVSVLARQLAKKSFRSYVLGNLDANQLGALPVIYRLT